MRSVRERKQRPANAGTITGYLILRHGGGRRFRRGLAGPLKFSPRRLPSFTAVRTSGGESQVKVPRVESRHSNPADNARHVAKRLIAS